MMMSQLRTPASESITSPSAGLGTELRGPSPSLRHPETQRCDDALEPSALASGAGLDDAGATRGRLALGRSVRPVRPRSMASVSARGAAGLLPAHGASLPQQFARLQRGLDSLDTPPSFERFVELLTPGRPDLGVCESDVLQAMRCERVLRDMDVLRGEVPRWSRQILNGLLCGRYTLEWVHAHFFVEWDRLWFYPKLDLRACLEASGHRYEVVATATATAGDGPGSDPLTLAGERQGQLHAALVQQVVSRLPSAPVRTQLIGVVGSPGAGKSTLALCLQDALAPERSERIELDGYLHDGEKRRRERRVGLELFDMPRFAHDFARLRAAASGAAEGEEPIGVGRFDHAQNRVIEGTAFVPATREVVLVEGIFPFMTDEDARAYAVTIGVHADDTVRLQRMIRRTPQAAADFFRLLHFQHHHFLVESCIAPAYARCDFVVDVARGELLQRRT